MKPEPLKSWGLDGDTSLYTEHNIKAAVEWLKQKDDLTFQQYFNEYFGASELWAKLSKNREIAFADVVK